MRERAARCIAACSQTVEAERAPARRTFRLALYAEDPCLGARERARSLARYTRSTAFVCARAASRPRLTAARLSIKKALALTETTTVFGIWPCN